jgi:two-component system phosphate regulon sensor histidine kinase PhoR
MAIDNDERLLSINQAAARILKRKPSALQHQTIQEVVRNPDLNRFVKEALASSNGIERDIVLHEEGERTLHLRSTLLRDPHNKQIGILVVLNDVTQLRQLENMRRDFAANVSHEIKTPLTAIKGFVETLRHNAVEDKAETQRFLGIIEKHVKRLTAIIEDLMHLSRIERQKETDLILARRDLKEVLQSAIAHCLDAARKKNIRIEFRSDQDLTALIDATLLEQAFVNLLDNAVKYSEAESVVEVSTFFKDEEVAIQVMDHGIGIPPEHLPRLFERFYRVDKARDRKWGGTGLGLAIVKHIVQAHHGRITVKSRPGEGSAFTIFLPKPKAPSA